jgi:hypothetical protein
MRLVLEACRLGRLAEQAAAELPPELPEAVRGRPEEEWRRRQPEPHKAVPPGGRPPAPFVGRLTDTVGDAAGAEEVPADCVAEGGRASMQTIADTPVSTAGRAREVALAGGGR